MYSKVVTANTAERLDMVKKCGNCEYWDREKAGYSFYANRSLASCNFPTPISVKKTMTYENEGQDCPVYLERK